MTRVYVTEAEKRIYELLNKTITNLYLNSAKDEGYIICSDKSIYRLECVGDCCSSAWIQHINGIENLLGNKIVKIDIKEQTQISDGSKWYDKSDTESQIMPYGCVIASGFYTFLTTKGFFDIELRISHNGYYGGQIEIEKTVGIPVILDSVHPEILKDF